MQFIHISERETKACKFKVEFQNRSIRVKFEQFKDLQSISQLENSLNCQNIQYEKSVVNQESIESIQIQIIFNSNICGDNQPKFDCVSREQAINLSKHLLIASLNQHILCQELFFNEFAILIPLQFFELDYLIQSQEIVKILNKIDQTKKNHLYPILAKEMIVKEYEYCLNILRSKFFQFTINWKNVKQIISNIDKNEDMFSTNFIPESVIIDYIKSPNFVLKILSSLKETTKMVRLNTCVLQKLDILAKNQNLKNVEQLEILSVNQDQYIYSASRVKTNQILNLQQIFTGLRKFTLEDIAVDCIQVNSLEELYIINNSSDMLNIELNSNCCLHTLVIQKTNVLSIQDMDYLKNLQKLVLYQVDILEKDLQSILDNAQGLRYLKIKDIHFINTQFNILNKQLVQITLDSLQFEQEFNDLFPLQEYSEVKQVELINCRINQNKPIYNFNCFPNIESFNLVDQSLHKDTVIDLNKLQKIKYLKVSCKQCEIKVHPECKLQLFEYKNTEVTNIDEILQQCNQSLIKLETKLMNINQDVMNSINKYSISNLQYLILSQCKLEKDLDFSQIALQSPQLSIIDISNNQITRFKIQNKILCINKIDVSFNLLACIDLDIQNANKILLNNNKLTEENIIISLNEINYLCLHKNLITNADRLLEKVNKIDDLDLSTNQIEQLELKVNLKTFNLSENNLKSIQLHGEVEKLDISKNKLNEINESSENQITIQYLNAKSNNITKIPSVSQNTIKKLDISNNKIQNISNRNLSFPNLQNLNLSNNQIISSDYLFQSENFPLLEVVNLSSNHIESLEHSANNLNKLTTIDFSKNRIDSCDPLFSYPGCIENIDLSFNSLIGLTRYQINPKNNIKELKLRKNSFTDNSLNKLSNLNSLERLDLSLNLFTNQIKFVHELPNLKCLSLALNNLQNEGLNQIFESIEKYLPQLYQIDIMHTQGNKLPVIKSDTVSFICQDNNLFFDNLDENKQLYSKGVLFQQ